MRPFLLLFLLAFPLAACGVAPTRITVMTWNIHHGLGDDGAIDLERIAARIRSAQPDLVALQEVDVGTERSGGRDQLQLLADATGMQGLFGRAIRFDGGMYGHGLLTTLPIREQFLHPLPRPFDGEDRSVLETALIFGPDRELLRVFSTHLDHAAVDARNRIAQARFFDEVLAVADDAPTPMLLLGDLNDDPDSVALRTLLRTWRDASSETPAPTFPAGTPMKRIDYVLFRPARRWKVLSSQVLDARGASDHRPVLTVLELVPLEPAVDS